MKHAFTRHHVPPRKNRGVMEYGYALAFLALLAVLLTPFASFRPVANDALAGIQICTPTGLKTISADGIGDVEDEPGATRHCPLCYLRQPGVAVLPQLSSLPVPAFSGKALFMPLPHHASIARDVLGPYSPRGPPVSVI